MYKAFSKDYLAEFASSEELGCVASRADWISAHHGDVLSVAAMQLLGFIFQRHCCAG
jgi:hypothetical protein